MLNRISDMDNLETMTQKLQNLAKNINQIQYSAMYDRSQVYGAYGYSYVILKKKEKCSGYVYSQDNAIKLKQDVDTMIKQIRDIVNNNPDEKDELERDARRVLFQTYMTITEPSASNYEKLKDIANDVNGKPHIWRQIGMVLLSIALLVCAVVPGILYIKHIAKEGGEWDKYKRQGLSEAADEINDKISDTGAPNRMYEGRFFQRRREQVRQEQREMLDQPVKAVAGQ